MATPIGNLQDISRRAVETLEKCHLIAAEDTRVTAKLLSSLGIKKPLIPFHAHSPKSTLQRLLREIQEGATVALVTDAGSPPISDPGAELVDLAYQSGLVVDAIPGPSAVTNALALAGFRAQRFVFLGFLPKKPRQAERILEGLRDFEGPLVLFENPHRVLKMLELVQKVLGERRVALCREMTKKFQEVLRGWIGDLLASPLHLKGEVTLVIEESRKKPPSGRGDLYP